MVSRYEGAWAGGALAAPALDAHHADEGRTAHAPLGGGLVQVANGGHEPRLAVRHQRARRVAQRVAVPVHAHLFAGRHSLRSRWTPPAVAVSPVWRSASSGLPHSQRIAVPDCPCCESVRSQVSRNSIAPRFVGSEQNVPEGVNDKYFALQAVYLPTT